MSPFGTHVKCPIFGLPLTTQPLIWYFVTRLIYQILQWPHHSNLFSVVGLVNRHSYGRMCSGRRLLASIPCCCCCSSLLFSCTCIPQVCVRLFTCCCQSKGLTTDDAHLLDACLHFDGSSPLLASFSSNNLTGCTSSTSGSPARCCEPRAGSTTTSFPAASGPPGTPITRQVQSTCFF